MRRGCEAFEQRTGIATALVVLDRGPLQLDAARAEALLGAAREALLNIEKHADAATVVVTLGRGDGVLQLTVTDDGHDLEPGGDRAGLGLAEQRRRFACLGGAVAIAGLDDCGAALRASLPLDG